MFFVIIFLSLASLALFFTDRSGRTSGKPPQP